MSWSHLNALDQVPRIIIAPKAVDFVLPVLFRDILFHFQLSKLRNHTILSRIRWIGESQRRSYGKHLTIVLCDYWNSSEINVNFSSVINVLPRIPTHLSTWFWIRFSVYYGYISQVFDFIFKNPAGFLAPPPSSSLLEKRQLGRSRPVCQLKSTIS